MPRLLILSNRLPVTLRVSGDEVSVTPSNGGLTAALRTVHEGRDAVWLGWPGNTSGVPDEERPRVLSRLSDLRAVPVDLDADEVSRYYAGFSNGTLWPLLHHFLDTARLDDDGDFEAYEAINERFADAAARQYRPGDTIWVHDYHLMLVPAMLRERLPRARIGFFLHTPFPSSEVFRMLPQRERLLGGLLGADLLGFQVASYRRHFAQAVTRLLDLEPGDDTVAWEGRSVHLGVYPIGIDAACFADLASTPAVRAEAQRIREQAPDLRIVLGVDRLDYTKGLRLRLAAIERLLDHAPRHRRVRFVQLAVPTREGVLAYEQMRREVHEMVGRINGRHGSVDSVPIHFLDQTVTAPELAALYAAADVMLVTPLRDGMNLIAKEYVATRIDGTGALVLSELTGAADDLVEALVVNPYDTGAVARSIEHALAMPVDEQRVRMTALRRRVEARDVHAWARSFLGDLDAVSAVPGGPGPRVPAQAVPERICARLRAAPALTLLLDYDGTLVPLSPLPELATPDAELFDLLAALAGRAATSVHVASGRSFADLDRWFGGLAVDLHAEHGVRWRPAGGAWTTVPLPPPVWRAEVRALFDEVSRRTPGCVIEEKTAGFAWHYRTVEVEVARARLRELTGGLAGVMAAHDLELIRGAKVLEVRPRGPGKGLAVGRALAHAPRGAAILAIGDDRTDEDLFAALPEGALAIHVGRGASLAPLRLPDVAAVRSLLRALL